MTDYLVRNDLAREANPFLISWAGETGFLALKISGGLLAVLVLWDIRRHHPGIAFWTASSFLLIYTGIVLWNCSLILKG